jgi:signal transduction histidine kinase
VIISLAEENRQARLCVSDSGIGIPDHERKNIFRRFYRVDRARDSENHGTGLGFHICKRIVEAHDGSISVEKNAPGGATFVVWLPLSK